GGAIYSFGTQTEIVNCTFSGNQSTGASGAIWASGLYNIPPPPPPATFNMWNTIIANNGVKECQISIIMATTGGHNLIMQNSGCPGAALSSDPQLQSLQLNSPGNTPTMGIPLTSPAVDAADPDPRISLTPDQRFVTRPQPPGGKADIGAF